jgi:hypothetical protein
MSLAVLYRKSQTRKNAIGSLTIEATISENHRASSQVTKQTIEDGSSVSDHIINDPETVTIEGFISNTPISGGFQNNAQNAFDELYRIRENKQLITVVTGYRVYNNMAITNINVPRDRSTGQSIRFTVDLAFVRTVGNTNVSFLSGTISDVGGASASASRVIDLGRAVPGIAGINAQNAAFDIARRLFT